MYVPFQDNNSFRLLPSLFFAAMASSSSNDSRRQSNSPTHVPQCRLRTSSTDSTDIANDTDTNSKTDTGIGIGIGNGTRADASEGSQKECYYYQPPTSQLQQQQLQQQQPLQHQQRRPSVARRSWPSLQFGPWLGAMTAYRLLTISLLIGILCLHHVHGVDPKFDPSTRMRLVLVPADAQVGSVIYRLRATDEEFDYPLTFEFMGDASSSTVKVESLPCTKYNSVCQANVVLQRRLEPGRYYDFQVSVKDTNGGIAMQLCSITATNFSTPHDLIFPHKPGIIMIPEVSTPRNPIIPSR